MTSLLIVLRRFEGEDFWRAVHVLSDGQHERGYTFRSWEELRQIRAQCGPTSRLFVEGAREELTALRGPMPEDV